MQTGMINKNKRSPNLQLVFVKSAETTKTINKGSPCYWDMDGTDDGLDVKSPSSGSAALANAFFAGVPAKDDLGPGVGGAVIAHGFVPNLRVTRATRANSTASWSSSASVAAGVRLLIDTVNDNWDVAGSPAYTNPKVMLGESIASLAASASATSDTRTAIVVNVKGFLFNM